MNRLLLLALLAVAGVLFAPQAHAASCTITTPSGTLVNFGRYIAFQSSNVDGIGTFTFVCTPDLPLQTAVNYTLRIDGGTGAAGGFNPRMMRGLTASGALRYNLYRDANRQFILGDGTAGTSTLPGSCASTCVTMIYGRLFGGQGGSAGSYSDTVMVTVDY